MKREYKMIILLYIAMQLSSAFGAKLTSILLSNFGYVGDQLHILSISIWLIFSFSITLFITIYYLRKELTIRNSQAASFGASLFWAIAGIFLALLSQSIAIQIESFLGIKPGSENTNTILALIEKAPMIILVSSVIGPILEEIIFRKIIFGTLYKKLNFFLAASISSIIFALAHLEFEHLLLYSAIGFTFAFLYVKTKRILVPIIAHVSMNTIAVLTQLIFREEIEEWIKTIEQTAVILFHYFY